MPASQNPRGTKLHTISAHSHSHASESEPPRHKTTHHIGTQPQPCQRVRTPAAQNYTPYRHTATAMPASQNPRGTKLHTISAHSHSHASESEPPRHKTTHHIGTQPQPCQRVRTPAAQNYTPYRHTATAMPASQNPRGTKLHTISAHSHSHASESEPPRHKTTHHIGTQPQPCQRVRTPAAQNYTPYRHTATAMPASQNPRGTKLHTISAHSHSHASESEPPRHKTTHHIGTQPQPCQRVRTPAAQNYTPYRHTATAMPASQNPRGTKLHTISAHSHSHASESEPPRHKTTHHIGTQPQPCQRVRTPAAQNYTPYRHTATAMPASQNPRGTKLHTISAHSHSHASESEPPRHKTTHHIGTQPQPCQRVRTPAAQNYTPYRHTATAMPASQNPRGTKLHTISAHSHSHASESEPPRHKTTHHIGTQPQPCQRVRTPAAQNYTPYRHTATAMPASQNPRGTKLHTISAHSHSHASESEPPRHKTTHHIGTQPQPCQRVRTPAAQNYTPYRHTATAMPASQNPRGTKLHTISAHSHSHASESEPPRHKTTHHIGTQPQPCQRVRTPAAQNYTPYRHTATAMPASQNPRGTKLHTISAHSHSHASESEPPRHKTTHHIGTQPQPCQRVRTPAAQNYTPYRHTATAMPASQNPRGTKLHTISAHSHSHASESEPPRHKTTHHIGTQPQPCQRVRTPAAQNYTPYRHTATAMPASQNPRGTKLHTISAHSHSHASESEPPRHKTTHHIGTQPQPCQRVRTPAAQNYTPYRHTATAMPASQNPRGTKLHTISAHSHSHASESEPPRHKTTHHIGTQPQPCQRVRTPAAQNYTPYRHTATAMPASQNPRGTKLHTISAHSHSHASESEPPRHKTTHHIGTQPQPCQRVRTPAAQNYTPYRHTATAMPASQNPRGTKLHTISAHSHSHASESEPPRHKTTHHIGTQPQPCQRVRTPAAQNYTPYRHTATAMPASQNPRGTKLHTISAHSHSHASESEPPRHKTTHHIGTQPQPCQRVRTPAAQNYTPYRHTATAMPASQNPRGTKLHTISAHSHSHASESEPPRHKTTHHIGTQPQPCQRVRTPAAQNYTPYRHTATAMPASQNPRGTKLHTISAHSHSHASESEPPRHKTTHHIGTQPQPCQRVRTPAAQNYTPYRHTATAMPASQNPRGTKLHTISAHSHSHASESEPPRHKTTHHIGTQPQPCQRVRTPAAQNYTPYRHTATAMPASQNPRGTKLHTISAHSHSHASESEPPRHKTTHHIGTQPQPCQRVRDTAAQNYTPYRHTATAMPASQNPRGTKLHTISAHSHSHASESVPPRHKTTHHISTGNNSQIH
ncbi:UNVERIFIED_CONTAM: hypothetical protein FKN15_061014 [Acipenser sinensis]